MLLVVFSAPRGFSPGTPVSPFLKKTTFVNSNSIQNARPFVTWALGPGDRATTPHVAELKYWFDMWKSFFFQLTIGAQGWREHRGFEPSRQRISEMKAWEILGCIRCLTVTRMRCRCGALAIPIRSKILKSYFHNYFNDCDNNMTLYFTPRFKHEFHVFWSLMIVLEHLRQWKQDQHQKCFLLFHFCFIYLSQFIICLPFLARLRFCR